MQLQIEDWRIPKDSKDWIHTSRSAGYSQANHPMISHAFCCKSERGIVVSTTTSNPQVVHSCQPCQTCVFFGETRLSKWSVAAGSWPFLVHKTPRSSPGPTITGAIWGYTMNWIAVRDHVSHVSQSIAMPWANGLTGQGYWLWEERSIVAARCLVECTSAASERNLSRLEPIRNISETLWCRFTKRILVCAYKDRNLQEMYE